MSAQKEAVANPVTPKNLWAATVYRLVFSPKVNLLCGVEMWKTQHFAGEAFARVAFQ